MSTLFLNVSDTADTEPVIKLFEVLIDQDYAELFTDNDNVQKIIGAAMKDFNRANPIDHLLTARLYLNDGEFAE